MKTQHKRQYPSKNNVTKKHRPIRVHGEIQKENQEGWKIVHIYGTPEQRGFAHGFLLYKELERVLFKFPFIVKQEIQTSYKKYLSICKNTITPIVKEQYPEYYQEIAAIVRGALYQNPKMKITTDILIAWNSLMSMYE